MKKWFKLLFNASLLTAVTPAILIGATSCASDDYFEEGKMVEIKPRLIVDKNDEDKDFQFPWYATPSFKNEENHSKRIYPPYLRLWAELFPDEQGLTEDKLDANHIWPKTVTSGTGLITYSEFFLDPHGDVCKALGLNPQEDFKNINQLIKDSNIPHDEQGNITQPFNLNLSQTYLHNEFADEAIKVWLNPIFIQNLKSENNTSFWDYVSNLDLSNNNLWYLPLIGYNDAANSEDDKFARFKKTNVLENLNSINLSNNQLTCLPHIASTEKYDLTKCVKKIREKDPSINLVGNCVGYFLGYALSKNLNYSNNKVIDLGNFQYDPVHEVLRQSIAFYSNFSLIDSDVKLWLGQAVSKNHEKVDENYLKDHIDLDSQPDEKNISGFDPILDKTFKSLDDAKDDTWGSVLLYYSDELINQNFLSSSYVHCSLDYNAPPAVLQFLEGSYYMYDYAFVESEKWEMSHSIEVPFPQTYDFDKNSIKHLDGEKLVFGYDISYPYASKILTVLFSSVFGFSGLFISWIWLYYGWLRKIIANKRKKANLICLIGQKEKEDK